MTCTDLDRSKVFKNSKHRPPCSIDFPKNPTYTCKTTYVEPFSVPSQVLSLGWTVQTSPIRAGWAAHSQEQHVDTYWETQASNGKQQETATKDCPSSASLVCVLNHALKKKKQPPESLYDLLLFFFICFLYSLQSLGDPLHVQVITPLYVVVLVES